MWRATRRFRAFLHCLRQTGRELVDARGDRRVSQHLPRRRLRRIIAQKKIAGVCAGFAEYFDTDITLMRVIWVALLLLPPQLGLIAYIVAWVVLPKS